MTGELVSVNISIFSNKLKPVRLLVSRIDLSHTVWVYERYKNDCCLVHQVNVFIRTVFVSVKHRYHCINQLRNSCQFSRVMDSINQNRGTHFQFLTCLLSCCTQHECVGCDGSPFRRLSKFKLVNELILVICKHQFNQVIQLSHAQVKSHASYNKLVNNFALLQLFVLVLEKFL